MIISFNVFEKKESGIFSVNLLGEKIVFTLLYSDEIYIMMGGEIYQALSITIPDTDLLGKHEFFINPGVDEKIITVLEKENFIEKSNKTSIAGDKETMSYYIINI